MLPILTLLSWLAVPAVLTPDQAVRAALSRDPALAARVAEVEAAAGLLRQSGPLQNNPEVGVSASTNGDRQSASLVQPLSLTGEGRHGLRAARAALEGAKAAAERARFETAAETRRVYTRAVVSRELQRFAEESRALLARLRGVAEARLAAGEGIDLDIRLARLEEARAMALWLAAQAETSATDADLAALIGMTPGELGHDPLLAGPVTLEGTNVRAGTNVRSDLLAARSVTEAARATVAREQAARLPAVGLGVFYERDSGRTIFGPAVTMTVPLWNQNQANLGAARGKLRLAEVTEASVVARATTEEARAEERLRVATESLKTLAPDIRTEADAALRAIEILFTSGEANLADTLLLRSRVIEGERAWIEARAAVAVARIEVALARQSESLLP